MARRTLAAKVGVSPERMGEKIAEVRRHDPELSSRQAAGKAAGILMQARGRRRASDVLTSRR